MEHLKLHSNFGDVPLATFSTHDGHSVQDDYVATSSGIYVSAGSQRTVEFAHLVKGANHEPVVVDILVRPGASKLVMSRRKPKYDRKKLTLPAIQHLVREGLATIVVPPRHIEQTTRCHIISEAVGEVLAAAAPPSRRPPKTRWVSNETLTAVDFRDQIFK